LKRKKIANDHNENRREGRDANAFSTKDYNMLIHQLEEKLLGGKNRWGGL